MAFIAERQAIRDFIAKLWIQGKGLDMMCVQHLISCTTILADVVISFLYCFTPFNQELFTTWFTRVIPDKWMRYSKLVCDHGGSALMRTKEKLVAAPGSFCHFAWVAVESITAIIASDFYHLDPFSNTLASLATVNMFPDSQRWVSFKLLAANLTGKEHRLTAAFVGAVTYLSTGKGRGTLKHLAASRTGQGNFSGYIKPIANLRAKPLLGVHVPIAVRFFWDDCPANFTML